MSGTKSFAAVFALALTTAVTAAQDRGSVLVQSEPGVEVVWEGVQLGETDSRGELLIDHVPAGEFSLRFSKPGRETAAETVRLGSGEGSTLRIALRGAATGAAVEPAPPAEARVDDSPSPSQDQTSASAEEPRVAEQANEPPGASPVRAAAAASIQPTAPARAASRRPWALWLIAIVAVGTLAAFVMRRRRPSFAGAEGLPLAPPVEGGASLARPSWEPPQVKNVAPAGSSESFLEDLRRRERALDGRTRREPAVIDAEFIEVDPDRSAR